MFMMIYKKLVFTICIQMQRKSTIRNASDRSILFVSFFSVRSSNWQTLTQITDFGGPVISKI